MIDVTLPSGDQTGRQTDNPTGWPTEGLGFRREHMAPCREAAPAREGLPPGGRGAGSRPSRREADPPDGS